VHRGGGESWAYYSQLTEREWMCQELEVRRGDGPFPSGNHWLGALMLQFRVSCCTITDRISSLPQAINPVRVGVEVDVVICVFL